MGYHRIYAAAFGVGSEAPLRLEAALARAGRRVLQRTRLPLDGLAWPVARPNAITWVLREYEVPEGLALQIQEYPADGHDGDFYVDHFDLVFLRALSEEIDGFVIAYDMLASACQDGFAVFFAGRTLETALIRAGRMSADPCVGLASLDALGTQVDRAFNNCYQQMFESSMPALWQAGTVIMAEHWELTPRTLSYALEAESRDEQPIYRALLVYVGEEGLAIARELLPPGFRFRVTQVGFDATKLLEVQGPGDVDCRDAFAEISRRLDCVCTVVTIRGGNGVNAWDRMFPRAEHRDSDAGTGAGAAIVGFSTASTFYNLGPALLFGRGNEGWIE